MSASDSGWYGSADRWPNHPYPFFRQLLAKARRRGWLLRKGGGSAHIFGRLYCGEPSTTQDPCVLVIFSTGSGAESVARHFDRQIDNCPHRDTALIEATTRAEELLAGAERLIEAADRLISGSEIEQSALGAWARAEELIDAADENLEEVRALLEEADASDEAAVRARMEAQELLRSTRFEGATDPQELLGGAEDAAREVGALTTATFPADAQRRFRRRLSSLRTKISDLRRRSSNFRAF